MCGAVGICYTWKRNNLSLELIGLCTNDILVLINAYVRGQINGRAHCAQESPGSKRLLMLVVRKSIR